MELKKIEVNNYDEKNINAVINDGMNRLYGYNDKHYNTKIYNYHKLDCENYFSNPFNDSTNFYKRGKSSSNSIKYQCKCCKKITNVLPMDTNIIDYYQQKSDYHSKLLQNILENKSISWICKNLNITNKTYYHKLQLISNQFYKFQMEHENKYFNKRKRDTLYINTNTYNSINNKCKMIFSCDFLSGYVFRSDVENNSNYLDDFYTKITIPHYCILRDSINVSKWIFITSNNELSNGSIEYALKNNNYIIILDKKENQLNKFYNYINYNIDKFNSKYIYYYLNISRVIYNFSYASCIKNNKYFTPAQMLGLTDKKYTINEILTNKY